MKKNNLSRRNQRVLTIFLVLAMMSACQKNVAELRSVEVGSTIRVSTNTNGNLIWQDNADGDNFLTTYVSKQTATPYGITASSEQVFNGTKSFRFELRDTDPENHNGTRAEIATPNATSNNLWYSYALFIPGALYRPDPDDEVITQWHGGGGVTPAICIRTKSDHMYLRIMGVTWVDLGAINHDKWHTYVFHIKHSSGSDGLIEIWRDGVKIIDRSGQNMYSLSLGSDYHLPQWKFGIYKSDWNGNKTTSTNLRVLYFDEVKYANGGATYEEMLPYGRSNIEAFKLVNAATEKEIFTIANGQRISLSANNLEKVNLRAVTSGAVGSVKFELSGRQSKTYTDNLAPFALHGDDGNGNYYYGNWNPPALGTYTLKATPYDVNGIAGGAKTITFTIAK